MVKNWLEIVLGLISLYGLILVTISTVVARDCGIHIVILILVVIWVSVWVESLSINVIDLTAIFRVINTYGCFMINVLRVHCNLLLLGIKIHIELLEPLLISNKLLFEFLLGFLSRALQPHLFLLLGKILWLQRLVRIFYLAYKKSSLLVANIELSVPEHILYGLLTNMRLIIDGDLRLREAEPFILLARARADK